MERLSRSHAAIDVFNILDQKLVFANPDYYAYTIGKFALWGAGRAWRHAPRVGLRVFGLLPGLLLTSGEQSQDNYEASRAANPLGRAITIGDLTLAIDFALDSPGLPAQDFVIDAGETLLQRRRDVAFDDGLHGDAPQ
jgi:NAD(P)-dependent dehydrogenase (short-subunit alcohol dehydrogenase family)